MSGPADFEAYRRYLEIKDRQAVEVIPNGPAGQRPYIQVDYDGFRNLDAQATQRLVDKFNRAANDGRYDADETLNFKKDVDAAQRGVRILAENGGGLNQESQNVVLLDSKTISYRQFAAEVTARPLTVVDAPQEKLMAAFTREHETAHQMLGLEEAGADYMASKRLLELYPGKETEGFLQQLSDLRMMGPYRAGPENVGEAMRYGYGCSEAINSAISESRNGENFSLEENYSAAKGFDAHNGKNFNVSAEGYKGPVRPEMVVRKSLLEVDPSLADNVYKPGSLSGAAEKLIQSGKFETGTPMNHILEDIVGASKRIDQALDNAPPFENRMPAPAPSLQAGMQP